MRVWRKFINIPLIIAAVTALTGVLTLHGVSAATGSIYLTPGTSSVQNGNSLTLNLRINPGATVDGVQATVNFDTTKLQYVSANVSGSAFSAQLQQTQSGGTITIARGDFSGGISSDALIESITFKGLVGSGSSGVTLTNANATDHSSGNYTNPSVGNATVNFSSPPATCPSGQTGTPPNCTTPPSGGGGGTSTGGGGGGVSPGPSPTPVKTAPPTTGGTTNAPIIGTPVFAFTMASITATSQVPTQMYVQYGTDQATLDTHTALTALGTTHTLSLDSSKLTPGETYYYIVVSKDAQGHTAQSSLQTLKLKGLTVTVGVYDKDHHPLKNRTVTLHSSPLTGKTNDKGLVTFSDIIPGEHHVVYQNGSKSYDQPITVVNNVQTVGGTQTAPVQNVSVVYGFTQSSTLPLRAGILLLVLIVAVVIVWLATRRKVRLAAPTGAPLSMQPVVIGGKTPPPAASPAALDDSPTGRQLQSIQGPEAPAPGSNITPSASGAAEQDDTRRIQ